MTETRAPLASQADIDAFIDAVWLEDGLSANTLAAYRRDLTGFARWLEDPESYAREMADRYGEAGRPGAAGRAGQDAGAGRQGRHRSLVRVPPRRDPRGHGQPAAGGAAPLLRLGLARASRRARSRLTLEAAKQAPRMPKILSEAQVDALLRAPDLEQPRGLRDRAMLETLYATGLRVSELAGVRALDVSLNEGRGPRGAGQGRQDRLWWLGAEAAHWIDQYLARARPELAAGRVSDALFITGRGEAATRQAFWQLVKKYAVLADVRAPLSPHVLRHASPRIC